MADSQNVEKVRCTDTPEVHARRMLYDFAPGRAFHEQRGHRAFVAEVSPHVDLIAKVCRSLGCVESGDVKDV